MFPGMNHMLFSSLSLHQSPQLSVSSSLESTSTSLGGSFLFVEKGGEISSERLLSGHSVLPLHNHRNPGGSGEGLSTPNFCRCRYTSRHKLNGQSRVCLLALILTQTDHSFRGACIWVHEGILPYLCIHKSKKPLHAHTQNVCFLHYTLSSSNLLLVHCSEEIMSIPAALVLLVLNFDSRNISTADSLCRLCWQCYHQINTAGMARWQLLCTVHLCKTPHFCQSIYNYLWFVCLAVIISIFHYLSLFKLSQFIMWSITITSN